MNCLACHVSELPDDLQVLISDFVEDSLGVEGFERLESHRFPIHHLPLAAFPRVKMWTDCRDRAYSEAMISRQLPPILICGDQWLDGKNRVWAARHTGKSAVGCIDLSEIGVSIRFKALGRLRWKAAPTSFNESSQRSKLPGGTRLFCRRSILSSCRFSVAISESLSFATSGT
jgi:hypothetical protein